MKQLKDILFERLVLSKNKSSASLTLGDFMRWYAAPEGKPPLDIDATIDPLIIKTALEDNDKDIQYNHLVSFYNKHKDDVLIDLKEEIIIKKQSYPTWYRISFTVDNVYFTINLSESFEEFIKHHLE